MAFYSGSQTNAAGSLVTILDALLPNNANWSVDDTPATNERVYRCSYPGAECCLHVADNQTNYATVTIWEDWDAVAHAGVGIYSGTTAYWRKATATYWVILHDYHFIYAHFGTNLNYAYWCGNIDRYCPEYNTPILLAVRSTSTTSINPMGGLTNISTSCYMVCLDIQQKRNFTCWAEYAESTPAVVQGYMGATYLTTGAATRVFIEESAIGNSVNEELGIMRGVMALGTTPSGIAAGDTITDDNGDTWEVFGSGYLCLIRKA